MLQIGPRCSAEQQLAERVSPIVSPREPLLFPAALSPQTRHWQHAKQRGDPQQKAQTARTCLTTASPSPLCLTSPPAPGQMT